MEKMPAKRISITAGNTRRRVDHHENIKTQIKFSQMNQSYDQKGNLIIIQIKDILASKKVVRLRKTSSQPSKDSLTKAH